MKLTPGGPMTAIFHERMQWTNHADTPGLFVSDASRIHVAEKHLTPVVVVRGEAEVNQPNDVLVVGPIGSTNAWLTVTFRPELRLDIKCFHGSAEDFVREVEMKPEGSAGRIEYEALVTFLRVLEGTRGAKR